MVFKRAIVIMVRILFLAMYIALLIFLSEIGLRRYFPLRNIAIDQLPPIRYMLATNPRIGYELRPGVAGNNQDGLHDKDYPIEKLSEGTRMVVCGDSIAYGFGAREGENYSDLIEEMAVAAGKKVEVLNLGIPGYGTRQIVERLKDKGLKYKPDILIYGYWFNDFTKWGCAEDEYPFFSDLKGTLWEGYVQLLLRWPLLENLRGGLLNSQILQRFIWLSSLKEFRTNKETNMRNSQMVVSADAEQSYREFKTILDELSHGGASLVFLNSNPDKAEFQDYLASLDELAQICKQQRIRPVILFTPVISDFENYPYQTLTEFVRKLFLQRGVDEFVDALPFFAREPASAYVSQEGDLTHFNQRGHRAVAEALFDHFEKTGWQNK